MLALLLEIQAVQWIQNLHIGIAAVVNVDVECTATILDPVS
jgi:hypothetical protein